MSAHSGTIRNPLSGFEDPGGQEILAGEFDKSPVEEVRLEILSTTRTAWLQEILFFWTKLLIVLVTALVGVISLVVNAGVIEVLLRVGVTVLVTGFLGWMINFLFGKFILDAKYEELKEQLVDLSTVEINA